LLGGALIGIGSVSLATDSSACAAQDYAACVKILPDLLEIAGGAAAMSQNNTAANQTNPGAPTAPGNVTNDKVDTVLPPGIKVPDPNKPITFGTDSSGNPNFQFPPKEELEKLVKSGFENTNSQNGSTLDDALAKLNENYDKEKNAVAAYNQRALGLAPDTTNDLMQVASNDGLTPVGSDIAGLNNGSKTGSSTNNSSLDDDSSNSSDNHSPNSTVDLDALKKSRGASTPVKMIGLNTENSSGRALTIFERVSRAIRGDRNRDLTLAKIEWARKEAFNKQKAPTLLVPKVKISSTSESKKNSTSNRI